LNREIALKVLPDAFAQGPERMVRFQREAQLLAALNHPNIAGIYGLEESSGVRALVMELVEGPTLAERIARSPLASGSSPSDKGDPPATPPLYKGGPQGGAPLPLEEALSIARQVAEGLEYAHEKGIVHRDLKPANLKITSEGVVKILDFGLAKAAEGTSVTGNPVGSPTPALPVTETGLILGTAAYLAPEQARGQMADRRVDIWAFGVVLYEMLAGRQLFGAETVSDTLVAVLKNEPDMSALPATVPASIQKLLRRCLERDRKKRLQAIGDARIEIEECLSAPAVELEVQADTPTRDERATRGWERLVWSIITVVLLAVIGSLVGPLRPARPSLTAIVAEITPPANARIRTPVISPDGRTLAFSAMDASGKQSLWVRPLDSPAAQPLVGTEGTTYPFWSADSRALGFFADDKLKTIEAFGGPVTVVADAPIAGGGSWSRDGTIVFASETEKAFYRVAASGGSPVQVLKMDATKYWACAWPSFLPDGRHFVYSAYADDLELGGTYFASLDGTENRLLIRKGVDAIYSQGFLLTDFFGDDALVGQPFDPERGQLTGDPQKVAENIDMGPYREVFDASQNGVLIYRTGTESHLAWFDRSGKKLDSGTEAAAIDASLSPDGRQLAFLAGSPYSEVYVEELARGVSMRVTVDPDTDHGIPVWSPDGSRLLYPSAGKARKGIYQKLANGTGVEELLLAGETPNTILRPSSWSSDGRFVLYSHHANAADDLRGEIWVLPLEGDRQPRPLVRGRAAAREGRFAPDVRWVAYTSGESGRDEVYVVPFDAAKVLNVKDESARGNGSGPRWQISINGGSCPRWKGDGKEIFYLSADEQIVAVPVETAGNSLEVQTPRPLFRPIGADNSYDVTSDGKKFVVAASTSPKTPLTLVVNWTARLKK
jgi:serine/threonine protein kinase